ncbi:hypothetical protein EV679_2864 [Kerstersia gyiorum]|uniref:Uncharacterized protein n=1 Tax=Kerstersia gyiorum TaxID=206506 RepID=A0A4Q7MGG5_9BURK|nr:hypothetical protein [Kerstersia gyiorum]KAB0542532.1 hypothetical protein F7P85_13080 [Kerstersia gyiorum]RZS66707.1 hypothetical protein EV679_2864 [Kerstersia gyiorum]
MKIIEQLIELRRDILDAIGTVVDADGGMYWDTTRPNSTTRAVLNGLLDKHLLLAEKFGIYVVTRHCSCPNPIHNGYVISKGRHGIKKMGDPSFIWTGDQLFQGDRLSTCPCSSHAKPTKHWVIDEIVVRKHGATKRHNVLVNAVSDLEQAIENSGDNKPRSAIREYLLRAVLQLNDGILHQTVDEYIASRSLSAGKRPNDVTSPEVKRSPLY